MRMGKLLPHEKGSSIVYPEPRPKKSSGGLVVGKVSSNLVYSIYLPLWQELALESMQGYLHRQIDYDDLLLEAEAEGDGTVKTPPAQDPPSKPVFHSQYIIDDFADTLHQTAKHFSSHKGYKVHANAAKFERSLDEKYGIFRPFIHKYPEIEVFVRSMQRKYAMGYFSPLRSKPPPMPRSTAVIILFMMKRNNISWQIMVLVSLFLLVGLQPWALVVVVAIFHSLLEKRRRKVMARMDSEDIPPIEPYYSTSVNKEDLLQEPVGEPLPSYIEVDLYDTMILGSGPGALYTAALLSRAGRKVLVLSSGDDASGCLELKYFLDSNKNEKKFRNVPFDAVESSNISRISKQQQLLAPALCTTTDYQGGVRFAQIGTQADGHAFEILAIPGMGTSKVDDTIPFVLRSNGGLASLMDDTARLLGDGWPGDNDDVGNSLSGAYVAACQSMNASASTYYQSKVLPDSTNDLRSRSTYQEAGIRHASVFLDQCFPLNAHVRSLFAGIGLKGENIKPNATSMAAQVTNVCAAVSGEGMYYPVGGPRALCHALATVVEQCGGKVLTGVQCAELVFENKAAPEEGETDPEPPKCLGVKTADDRKIIFTQKDDDPDGFPKIVINTSGFIDTFIRLMPPAIRDTYNVPRGLPALSERRPTWRALFALSGSAQELDVTGADYYRLPNASIAFDEVDAQTGEVRLGVVGGKDDTDDATEVTDAINDVPTTTAESSAEKSHRNVRSSRGSEVKYRAGKSWMKVSFPSAKDPSFEERHGNVSTCVVTIEVDDDFVTPFDSKPKLFSMVKSATQNIEQVQRVLARVQKEVVEIFPQLEGKIVHGEMRGPFYSGLSHNPERFAAKGIRADTPYPNLYVGGNDLTLGDSFSGSIVGGWLTANAVVGYTTVDYLVLDKNITSDLERFVEIPEENEFEDLAVNYTPVVPERESELTQAAGEELESKKDQ